MPYAFWTDRLTLSFQNWLKTPLFLHLPGLMSFSVCTSGMVIVAPSLSSPPNFINEYMPAYLYLYTQNLC